MKIPILNDTHIGARSSSDVFVDNAEAFFRDIFFPWCDENHCSGFIHLGDFFDNRRSINVKVLSRVYQFFVEEMRKRGMHMHLLLGNHDTYWKDTNRINTPSLLLPDDVCTVHTEPSELTIDGLTLGLVPWICKENEKAAADFIRSTSARVLLGHFEIDGFKMIHGFDVKSQGGHDKNEFKNFELVLSGHYHTKSRQSNIYYLGAQLEFTWADCDDPKAFHLLDTKTLDVDAVRNTATLFTKYYYDEDEPCDDFSIFSGKYVKVIVKNRKDDQAFNVFLSAVEGASPVDVQVYDMAMESASMPDGDEDIVDRVGEAPSAIMDYYVDNTSFEEIGVDKDKLKKLLRELYRDTLAKDD